MKCFSKPVFHKYWSSMHMLMFWCCWCNALYHPPGSSFWARRPPQSEWREPKTVPFIRPNDSNWQWWRSCMTEDRLQRHFVLPWTAVGPNTPLQLQREVNKVRTFEEDGVMERCGYWKWQVKRQREKNTTGPAHFLIKHTAGFVCEVQASIIWHMVQC